MVTIHADFNAMTETRSICLTTRGSSDDIKKHGIPPGDRVKLSDGELEVEAVVAQDEYYGLVAILSWDTMIDVPESE